jgi:uncharacterized protein YabE (DUF348 family)
MSPKPSNIDLRANNYSMRDFKWRKQNLLFLVVAYVAVGYSGRALLGFPVTASENRDFEAVQKSVTIIDDGLAFKVHTNVKSTKELLDEQRIPIGEYDSVSPSPDDKIFSGSTVLVRHAKKIVIDDAGKKIKTFTLENTVEDAIWNQPDVTLGDDDFTTPLRNALVTDGISITVTHVLIKEETVEKPIDFKTVTNEDEALSWRIKKVTQKGEKGINEVSYRVAYYNGKEMSRKVLSQRVTKQPVDEVVTQGTYVKVGKASSGQASWYAYTGELCAANPWLPLGSYVRVTNRDNGKSVIVKINDRGPFGPGRIIDLDKVAFAKIANLGQGVANIKMEPITN